MSTDRRGKLRTKKLIAVPPLSAKHASVLTNGMTCTSRSACLKKEVFITERRVELHSLLGR